MLVKLGLSSTLPFSYLSSTFVANIGGWDSWRREVGDPYWRFHEVSCMRRRYIMYLFHWLIKIWCYFLSKLLCNGYWFLVCDHMLMLVILGFHIILIIIVLHVVKLVWGRFEVVLHVSWLESKKRDIKEEAWIKL